MKKWIWIAISLIAVGGIVTLCALSILQWDLTGLSTDRYVTRTHEIDEAFQSITVRTDTADVILVPSEDGRCRVTCYESEKVTHSIAVVDGSLTVEVKDERRWYERIGISFSSPRVTLAIPQGIYETLTVRSDTGDVEIPADFIFGGIDVSVDTGDVSCRASAAGALSLKATTGDLSVTTVTAVTLSLEVTTGSVRATNVRCAGDVTLKVSTGRANLSEVSCANLSTGGSTGDVTLCDVVASEGISIRRSTGDVRLERCDAARLSIVTDTGDVTGTLRSEKSFIARSDTGRVRVPSTTQGGRCEITTDTGDIRISIAES